MYDQVFNWYIWITTPHVTIYFLDDEYVDWQHLYTGQLEIALLQVIVISTFYKKEIMQVIWMNDQFPEYHFKKNTFVPKLLTIQYGNFEPYDPVYQHQDD